LIASVKNEVESVGMRDLQRVALWKREEVRQYSEIVLNKRGKGGGAGNAAGRHMCDNLD
jgi:hypothetical protein